MAEGVLKAKTFFDQVFSQLPPESDFSPGKGQTPARDAEANPKDRPNFLSAPELAPPATGQTRLVNPFWDFKAFLKKQLDQRSAEEAKKRASAQDLFEKGDFAAAFALYTELLQKDPRNAQLRELRAEATQALLETLPEPTEETADSEKEKIVKLVTDLQTDRAMLIALNLDAHKEALKEVEKESSKLQGDDPKKQQIFIQMLETQALALIQASQAGAESTSDAKFIQDQLTDLAAEVYFVLARFADSSTDNEIAKSAPLYEGKARLTLGDLTGARGEFEKIQNKIPEAKEKIELIDKARLRQTNLATLQVWKAYVEEDDEVRGQFYRSALGTAVFVGDKVLRNDGGSLDDERAIRVRKELDLIAAVEEKIISGKADTVQQALYQIAVSSPEEIKEDLIERANEIYKISLSQEDQGEDSYDILPRLIQYTSQLDHEGDLEGLLFRKAERLYHENLDHGVGLTAQGIFSILYEQTQDPMLKAEAGERVGEVTREKGMGDYLIAFLKTTSPENLAVEVSLLVASGGVGNAVKLATFNKLRQAGEVGWKARLVAGAAGAGADGSTLWALQTAKEATTHDLNRVLDPAGLAKSYGATILMIGSLKVFGAAGQELAPRAARALGWVGEEGAQLSKAGNALAWAIGHGFGLGGMIASTQLNQVVGFQEAPLGGFEESLVHDVFGYIRFALAHKLVDGVTSGRLSKIGHRHVHEIALREAQIKVEAELGKLKIKIPFRTQEGEPFFQNPADLQLYRQLVEVTLTRPGFSVSKFTGLIEKAGIPAAQKYMGEFGLAVRFQNGKIVGLRNSMLRWAAHSSQPVKQGKTQASNGWERFLDKGWDWAAEGLKNFVRNHPAWFHSETYNLLARILMGAGPILLSGGKGQEATNEKQAKTEHLRSQAQKLRAEGRKSEAEYLIAQAIRLENQDYFNRLAKDDLKTEAEKREAQGKLHISQGEFDQAERELNKARALRLEFARREILEGRAEYVSAEHFKKLEALGDLSTLKDLSAASLERQAQGLESQAERATEDGRKDYAHELRAKAEALRELAKEADVAELEFLGWQMEVKDLTTEDLKGKVEKYREAANRAKTPTAKFDITQRARALEFELARRQRIEGIRNALQGYGTEHNLWGLEGRIEWGLDPSGMLAVAETRAKVEAIAEKLGADMAEVEAFTNELHVGGIWKNAKRLSQAKDPVAQTWMILAQATRERQMGQGEFLKDFQRVNQGLEKAEQDPQGSVQRAKQELVAQAREKFRMEDGVPYSEEDSFLMMAIAGQKGGINRDNAGLLFIGAHQLNYQVLRGKGLTPTQDNLERGTLFLSPDGRPVVKFLNQGLAIVLNQLRMEDIPDNHPLRAEFEKALSDYQDGSVDPAKLTSPEAKKFYQDRIAQEHPKYLEIAKTLARTAFEAPPTTERGPQAGPVPGTALHSVQEKKTENEKSKEGIPPTQETKTEDKEKTPSAQEEISKPSLEKFTLASLEDPALKELNENVFALQVENPEDPKISEYYLVIANKLTELGDPRGEWIALELERGKLQTSGDPNNILGEIENRIGEIRKRFNEELWKEFADDFHTGMEPKLQFDFDVSTGFSLKLSPKQGYYDQILPKLSLFDSLVRVLGSEYGYLLRKLEIRHISLCAERFEIGINTSPVFSKLTTLSLKDNGLGYPFVYRMATSKTLSNLVALDLRENPISYLGGTSIRGGAEEIEKSPNLPNLKYLNGYKINRSVENLVPGTEGVDVDKITSEAEERIEAAVEKWSDGLSSRIIEEELREIFSEIARQMGKDTDQLDLDHLIDIKETTRYEPSTLPLEYQTPEDGGYIMTYTLGGKTVAVAKAGGDFYGGHLSSFDGGVLREAVQGFVEALEGKPVPSGVAQENSEADQKTGEPNGKPKDVHGGPKNEPNVVRFSAAEGAVESRAPAGHSPTALVRKNALPEPTETFNDLPVIDAVTYHRLYETDVRAMGEGGVSTFNFQGYVRENRPDYEPGTYYHDALATNGVLKGEGHPGVHIGTDGIVHYSARMENRRMKSSADVGEYDIYIEMPGEVQRELDCVVYDDRVHTVDDFRKSRYDKNDERGFAEQLKGAQNASDFIVMRLWLDPKEDPLAREKAAVIHHAIVRHIEQKKPGYLLEEMVRSLEEELMDIRKEDMRAQAGGLQEKALGTGLGESAGEMPKAVPTLMHVAEKSTWQKNKPVPGTMGTVDAKREGKDVPTIPHVLDRFEKELQAEIEKIKLEIENLPSDDNDKNLDPIYPTSHEMKKGDLERLNSRLDNLRLLRDLKSKNPQEYENLLQVFVSNGKELFEENNEVAMISFLSDQLFYMDEVGLIDPQAIESNLDAIRLGIPDSETRLKELESPIREIDRYKKNLEAKKALMTRGVPEEAADLIVRDPYGDDKKQIKIKEGILKYERELRVFEALLSFLKISGAEDSLRGKVLKTKLLSCFKCGNTEENLAILRMEVPELTIKLRALLKDADVKVRRAAAEALGEFGAKEAVPELLLLLNDEDTAVLWTTADALGSLGSQEAIPRLMDLLKHEDPMVKGEAARALGKLGVREAIPQLLQFLKEEDSLLIRAAINALKMLAAREAIPQLENLPEIKKSLEIIYQFLANEPLQVQGEVQFTLVKICEFLLKHSPDQESEFPYNRAEDLLPAWRSASVLASSDSKELSLKVQERYETLKKQLKGRNRETVTLNLEAEADNLKNERDIISFFHRTLPEENPNAEFGWLQLYDEQGRVLANQVLKGGVNFVAKLSRANDLSFLVAHSHPLRKVSELIHNLVPSDADLRSFEKDVNRFYRDKERQKSTTPFYRNGLFYHSIFSTVGVTVIEYDKCLASEWGRSPFKVYFSVRPEFKNDVVSKDVKRTIQSGLLELAEMDVLLAKIMNVTTKRIIPSESELEKSVEEVPWEERSGHPAFKTEEKAQPPSKPDPSAPQGGGQD